MNTISNFEVLSHVFQRTHSRSYPITFSLDREIHTGVFTQRKNKTKQAPIFGSFTLTHQNTFLAVCETDPSDRAEKGCHTHFTTTNLPSYQRRNVPFKRLHKAVKSCTNHFQVSLQILYHGDPSIQVAQGYMAIITTVLTDQNR